ncbi:glycosyltransferase family 4 protein [Streptomyces sp. SM1]|uniref:glycosyltransferase family 4 protein n=1 Tax=Streptomyces sp. SM1 TaxID=402229 RepID=UPI0021562CCA|nr:glycosyltransferase family 4 protein [Streptomyces sp. SM1]
MFIDIPSELEAALIDCSPPPWERDGSFLAQSTMKRYRTELTAIPRFEETATILRHALNGEGGGYAVLRLGNLAKALGTDDGRFLRLVTAFAAEVAVPFSPFPRWPLWKDIGVKVDKDPGKSSGIGYNAFHMDLVNAQRAIELGLRDRVHFVPFLPRAELWRRLPSFDAFVFTTKGLEAFGLVLIEAQAHGLPVFYSNLPGVREILGSAGVPCTPGDPRSLAVALDDRGRDVHRREALTKAALHNARRYDITATGRRLRELTLRVTS